jgi:hypothetical protein
MAETPQEAIKNRAAERRAIIREVVALARRADAAGLTAVAQFLELAVSWLDDDPSLIGSLRQRYGKFDA